MSERPNRLSNEELEQEAVSYRRYLDVLQRVQELEDDLCPGLTTRCFYHHGNLDIVSVSPSEPHYLGRLQYFRAGVVFINHPADEAADSGVIEPNFTSVISIKPDKDLRRQFEDLLYVLPDQLSKAYDVAVALRDAMFAVDDAIERNNKS